MNNSLEIRLTKSLIGRIPKHIRIAKQLGLSKINRTKVHPDNPAIRGMLNIIDYLVDVKECAK